MDGPASKRALHDSGHVRVLVVSNASSGSSNEETLRAVQNALKPLGEVSSLQPSAGDSPTDELTSAVDGTDLVVVAGGDGTMNHTVNALANRLDDFTLAVVPMGTGNDFARTLGLRDDPVAVASGLVDGRERVVDVSRASGPGVERLFLNACMGAFPFGSTRRSTRTRKSDLVLWRSGLADSRRLPI